MTISTSASGSERPAWLPVSLFPFTSRFVELEGSTIHYVDEGDGPVLLMLHGNPTWSFVYRQLIAGLRSRFRCIALDYPGFGLTVAAPGFEHRPERYSRLVEEFIEALELKDITLVTQDWGGPIGFGVAVRQPERFARFVVGNTFAWPVNGDPHYERFSNFMGGPIGRLLIRHANAFVNVMIPVGTPKVRLPRDVMRAYRAPFPTPASRMPTHLFPKEILASRSFLQTVEAGLSKLAKHPALILWGNRDIAFRAQERERWESVFPTHRTVILEGAGHFIQEDAPDEMIAAILSWSA